MLSIRLHSQHHASCSARSFAKRRLRNPSSFRGESIDLVAIDELLFQGGALSAEDEKAALDRALVISLTEAEAGLTLDLEEALDDLREKRRNAGQGDGAS